MENLNELALKRCLRFHGSDLFRAVSATDSQTASLVTDRCDLLRSRNELPPAVERKSRRERDFIHRLQGFIAYKLPQLFGQGESEEPGLSGDQHTTLNLGIERYGACPAFETYLNISEKKLQEQFFKDIRPGDILYGEIRSVDEVGITVRLLCVDSDSLQRDLEDLHLDVFIPRQELILSKPGEDPFSVYCKRKLLRAAVSHVNSEKRHLVLALKSTALLGIDRLGIVSENDLPAYFRADTKANYDHDLHNSLGFRNPSNVETLCRHFGISAEEVYSLSPSLLSRVSVGETAKTLRKMQSHRLAMKSVIKGVERLRNKEHAESMQHFNKALEIDPENVEGLVGRGALYANCDTYDLAIRDFEQALSIDPNHPNARLYLIETVLTQGKMFEKKSRQKAQACYQKVLQLQADNEDAIGRLRKLKAAKVTGKRRRNSGSTEEVVNLSSDGEDGPSTKKKPKPLGNARDEESSPNASDSSTHRLNELLSRADVGDPNLVDKLKRYYGYYRSAMRRKGQSKSRSSSKRHSKAIARRTNDSSGDSSDGDTGSGSSSTTSRASSSGTSASAPESGSASSSSATSSSSSSRASSPESVTVLSEKRTESSTKPRSETANDHRSRHSATGKATISCSNVDHSAVDRSTTRRSSPSHDASPDTGQARFEMTRRIGGKRFYDKDIHKRRSRSNSEKVEDDRLKEWAKKVENGMQKNLKERKKKEMEKGKRQDLEKEKKQELERRKKPELDKGKQEVEKRKQQEVKKNEMDKRRRKEVEKQELKEGKFMRRDSGRNDDGGSRRRMDLPRKESEKERNRKEPDIKHQVDGSREGHWSRPRLSSQDKEVKSARRPPDLERHRRSPRESAVRGYSRSQEKRSPRSQRHSSSFNGKRADPKRRSGNDQIEKKSDQIEKKSDQVQKTSDQTEKKSGHAEKKSDQTEKKDHVEKKEDTKKLMTKLSDMEKFIAGLKSKQGTK